MAVKMFEVVNFQQCINTNDTYIDLYKLINQIIQEWFIVEITIYLITLASTD